MNLMKGHYEFDAILIDIFTHLLSLVFNLITNKNEEL